MLRGMSRLLALLLALGVTAQVTAAHAATVAEVKKKGVLVLGTDPTFAPFEFKGKDGQIQGFDVDIARAVAKDLGVRLEVRAVGFGALMPAAVTSGRVDLAMSAVTITAERAAEALSEAKALGADYGVAVEASTVRARAIGSAIVERAREVDADLIVLGSAPRWRRQSRFFSPTVDYVLRSAPCEVLIVAFPQSVMDEELAAST